MPPPVNGTGSTPPATPPPADVAEPVTPPAGAPGSAAAAAEGTTAPVGGTNPPAGTDGGEAPVAEGGESTSAGATAEGADAAPDGDFYQSLGNQPDAPDVLVSDSDGMYNSPDTEDYDRTMNDLMLRAKNGDPSAITELNNWRTNQLLASQQTLDMMKRDQFQNQDAHADKDHKGKEGDADKLLTEAQQQHENLLKLEKRFADAQQKKFDPKNPAHQSFRDFLKTGGAEVAQQRKQLAGEIKNFEAKMQAAKMASAQKQLEAMTKSGKPLTEAQIATLKKQFGDDLQFVMKNGRMVVLKGEGQGTAVPSSSKGKQGDAAGNRNGERAPANSREAPAAEAPAGEQVAVADGDQPKDPDGTPKDATREFMHPTQEQVADTTQRVAVAYNLTPAQIEEKKKLIEERRGQNITFASKVESKMRGALGKGDEAGLASAEELGRARGIFRRVKQEEFERMCDGSSNVAGGVIFCDSSLAGIEDDVTTGTAVASVGAATGAPTTAPIGVAARDKLAGLERQKQNPFMSDTENGGIWRYLPRTDPKRPLYGRDLLPISGSRVGVG